jgi:DNA replication and repair protein RecF
LSLFIEAIYLRDFRCYPSACFEFSPGINAICGPNAQGKTSILEAIYLLIAGKSFRTSQLSDMIREGSSAFHVEAVFVKHGVQQTLKFSYGEKERRIIYNSTNLSSTANLLGLLPGVAITPDDVALVKGAPVARRHFLDIQLSQIDPLYVHHLTRYHRAMRQRNILLKRKMPSTIESWEGEMASSAAYITKQRFAAVKELQIKAHRFHGVLSSESEALALEYKSGAPLDSEQDTIRKYYLEQFEKYRPRELAFGSTLTGPHKDDLAIGINQREARFFGSEGQQRSCATALRLAEWERANGFVEEVPLMLIDDIGVSLDDKRRNSLLNYTPQFGQVFLSSTQEISQPTESKDFKLFQTNTSPN